MGNIVNSLVSVATVIVGLAFVAVLVSRNANTANVISATAGGLATAINAATAPVSNAPAAAPIVFPSVGGFSFGPT